MEDKAPAYRLHDATGHWIARVFAAMRSEFDKELRASGVTISEWAVLAAVSGGAAKTPSAVAELAGLDRAVVTRALDGLTDEKGLAERRLSGQDRRSFTIHLTASGKRLASHLLRANRRINERFLQGLSSREIEKFRRCLKHILGNAPGSPKD